MCYEIDYRIFAAQRKAQEAQAKQEQRAGVIDKLLNDANKQGEKSNVEGMPVEEVAPAKYPMCQQPRSGGASCYAIVRTDVGANAP